MMWERSLWAPWCSTCFTQWLNSLATSPFACYSVRSINAHSFQPRLLLAPDRKLCKPSKLCMRDPSSWSIGSTRTFSTWFTRHSYLALACLSCSLSLSAQSLSCTRQRDWPSPTRTRSLQCMTQRSIKLQLDCSRSRLSATLSRLLGPTQTSSCSETRSTKRLMLASMHCLITRSVSGSPSWLLGLPSWSMEALS